MYLVKVFGMVLSEPRWTMFILRILDLIIHSALWMSTFDFLINIDNTDNYNEKEFIEGDDIKRVEMGSIDVPENGEVAITATGNETHTDFSKRFSINSKGYAKTKYVTNYFLF
jgi:hypothetical protein